MSIQKVIRRGRGATLYLYIVGATITAAYGGETVIDTGATFNSNRGAVYQGRMVVAYEYREGPTFDGGNISEDGISEIRLWIDDGLEGGVAEDGLPNGAEIRRIDSRPLNLQNLMMRPRELGEFDGRLFLVYTVRNEGLYVWYDDGWEGGTSGNGLVDGNEVRTVETDSNVRFSSVGAVWRNNRFLLAYQKITDTDNNDRFNENDRWELRVWSDDGTGGGIMGNWTPDGSEIRTAYTASERFLSAADTLYNGEVLVVFKEPGSFNVWLDDGWQGGVPGDGIVNGAERRSSVNVMSMYFTQTRVYNGFLCLSYVEQKGSGVVRLWVDDGRNDNIQTDGIAGNLEPDGAETRTLAADVSGGELGFWQCNGRLAVAFQDGSTNGMRLWWDDGAGNGGDGDTVPNGTETRELDGLAGDGIDLREYRQNPFLTYFRFQDDQSVYRYSDLFDDGNLAGDPTPAAVPAVSAAESLGINRTSTGGSCFLRTYTKSPAASVSSVPFFWILLCFPVAWRFLYRFQVRTGQGTQDPAKSQPT